jgi:hypothetical protein
MSDRPYVAQDQPTIFIGGYWLDDAQGIEFQAQDPKEPLYGFRDTHFRSVARGQTLIHGMLDINFRYKNYLTTVLSTLAALDVSPTGGEFSPDKEQLKRLSLVDQKNDLRTTNLDPRSMSTLTYIKLLETPHTQFNIKEFTRLSDAVKSTFWDKLPTDDPVQRSRQSLAKTRPGEWPDPTKVPVPFDLTIVYLGADPNDPTAELDGTLVETLKGVYIVSDGKRMANEVPGGGDVIIERYQFIAQTIE